MPDGIGSITFVLLDGTFRLIDKRLRDPHLIMSIRHLKIALACGIGSRDALVGTSDILPKANLILPG